VALTGQYCGRSRVTWMFNAAAVAAMVCVSIVPVVSTRPTFTDSI
jgi:hypothetical protein